MAGTTVILMRSTDTGAPVLNGLVGSAITVLDACLVNGYNARTLTSITRSGTTATATFNGHGYAADGLTKVQISGADQADYNGIFSIANVTTNTFTFQVANSPVTPATGTITSKVPGSGWLKPFSGTNLAAYQSGEVSSTKLYCQVDDSVNAGRAASFNGYEMMSAVATGSKYFGTGVLNKSSTADSTGIPWTLASDGYEFIFFCKAFGSTYAQQHFIHFGDPASDMAYDPYGCLLIGAPGIDVSYPGQSGTDYCVTNSGAAQANHYFARNYTQTGGASLTGKASLAFLNGVSIGLGGLAYPSPANNGFYISPIHMMESGVIRAQLKCMYAPLHTRPLGHGNSVSAATSPIGRRLYAVEMMRGWTGASSGGEAHIDIDGPWR